MNFLRTLRSSGRKQDKEHFTHLLQVALADGKIENSELEMLYRSGRKLGLTRKEIDILLENSKIRHLCHRTNCRKGSDNYTTSSKWFMLMDKLITTK